MDDLTRERYPFHLPAREAHAPAHWSPEQIAEHRIVLCGTADLSVLQQGAGGGRPNRLAMHRQLLKAIRAYAASTPVDNLWTGPRVAVGGHIGPPAPEILG